MKKRAPAFFKKGDLFLIAAWVLVTALLFAANLPSKGGELTAVVYLEGREYTRIRLDQVTEPYALRLQGQLAFVLAVEKNRICYQSSDCPDKLCVHAGYLSKAGDFAACLPARSAVFLIAEGQAIPPVDFIAH